MSFKLSLVIVAYLLLLPIEELLPDYHLFIEFRPFLIKQFLLSVLYSNLVVFGALCSHVQLLIHCFRQVNLII